MEKQEILNRATALVSAAPYATMGTIGPSGAPSMRAMTVLQNDGLETVWFATGLNTAKVANLRQNPTATLFMADSEIGVGVTLIGTADVLTDRETTQRFWKPGLKRWFLQGPTDPNFCVLRFTAKQLIFSLDRQTTTIDL